MEACGAAVAPHTAPGEHQARVSGCKARVSSVVTVSAAGCCAAGGEGSGPLVLIALQVVGAGGVVCVFALSFRACRLRCWLCPCWLLG